MGAWWLNEKASPFKLAGVFLVVTGQVLTAFKIVFINRLCIEVKLKMPGEVSLVQATSLARKGTRK